MISTVTGSFNEFSAELDTDNDDFENSAVSFKAGVNSIDTGNKDRDGHLIGGDFFNAADFPSVSFVSTSFTKDGSDYQLKGDLTIKDVTKPATAKGTISVKNGVVTVVSEFTVQRKDYNVIGESFVQKKIADNIAIDVNCAYDKQ